jgi:hypothetical protein
MNSDAQEDEVGRLLREVLSPADAQSLVLPPPTHAPASGPGESTPLTGNLAKPPSQATPSRQSDPHSRQSNSTRQGLAGQFAGAPSDRSVDPLYVKVYSQGQIGYLPKINLDAARKIDANLKVLDEGLP